MHYEIMGPKRRPFVDSMQFHVSSSKRKAEAYIRKSGVSPYSWWQVHPYVVDDDDWANEGQEVHYYSHKGKSLRSAPFRQAERSYEREQSSAKKNRLRRLCDG